MKGKDIPRHVFFHSESEDESSELEDGDEPKNELIVPRHVLFHLEPEVVEIAEIIPEDAGVGQLRKDVMRNKSVKFNGVFPPREIASLEIDKFKNKMEVFLRSQRFSEVNIELIFKYYSQRPSYAVQLGQKLLTLTYNKQTYPDIKNIYILAPKKFTNHIFEKDGKAFFRTEASHYPVKSDDSLIITIKDKLESLFVLKKDEGFKLVHYRTFNVFTNLMERFLCDISLTELKEGLRFKQETSNWIFMYCVACNENGKVANSSREEIKKEKFKNIVNALSNPNLYRKVAFGLYEVGLYFEKKYEFGGGEQCGFNQLITNLTDHYHKQADDLIERYKSEKQKFDANYVKHFMDLEIYPGQIRTQLSKGEMTTTMDKDERANYPKFIIHLLDLINDLSRKIVYLKTISSNRQNESSNFILFKKPIPVTLSLSNEEKRNHTKRSLTP